MDRRARSRPAPITGMSGTSSIDAGRRERMKTLELQAGLLKAVTLGAVTLIVAGCKLDGAEMDDYYVPTAHYELHPIVVTKSGAHAKHCGEWSEDMTDTSQNEPYAELGCSHQNNIAAMVANPEDLIRPSATAPADPMRRTVIFDKYRTGEAVSSAE